jgi:hypothetical protein
MQQDLLIHNQILALHFEVASQGPTKLLGFWHTFQKIRLRTVEDGPGARQAGSLPQQASGLFHPKAEFPNAL